MRNILSTYLLTSVLAMAAGAATEAAGPVLPKRLSAGAKALLVKVGEAAGTPVLIAEESADAKTLARAGWLLTNPTTRDGKGNIQAILSESGKTKYDDVTKVAATPRASAGSPGDYEIEEGLDMPDFTASRRAPRQVYPFDKMAKVGASFFIPKPDEYPADKDFAQAKTSNISQQNRKLKEAWEAIPEGTEGKSEKPVAFKIVNDTKDGIAGARVWRIS